MILYLLNLFGQVALDGFAILLGDPQSDPPATRLKVWDGQVYRIWDGNHWVRDDR